MSVPEKSLQKIGFEQIDYSDGIEQAEMKSAAYFYAHASALLDSGSRKEAQLAYDELYLLARMFSQYRDLDKLLRRAVPLAADNLKFEIHNKTGKELNSTIASGVGNSFNILKDKKVTYQGKGTAEYDFTIQIILEEIKITRDQAKTRKFREERDIFGEDNKVIDTISCEVTEHFQRKASSLKGTVNYINNTKNEVINTVPVAVESIFLHKYGSVSGNLEAMSEETRQLISRKEAKYPSNEELIFDAVLKFKEKMELILAPYSSNLQGNL
jgi:hypothetical protein